MSVSAEGPPRRSSGTELRDGRQWQGRWGCCARRQQEKETSLYLFKNITDVAVAGLLVQWVPGTVRLNIHPVCSAPDKHRVTQGTRRPMSQC